MVDKFAGSKLEQLIQVGSVGPERAEHMDVRSQRAPDACAEDRTDSFRMWRDGRVVDKFAGSKLEQLIQVGSVGPERAKHMEVRSQRAPDGCAEDRTDSFRMWRDGRVVEGAPLLRVYGSKAHRGFESLSLRHSPPNPLGFCHCKVRQISSSVMDLGHLDTGGLIRFSGISFRHLVHHPAVQVQVREVGCGTA